MMSSSLHIQSKLSAKTIKQLSHSLAICSTELESVAKNWSHYSNNTYLNIVNHIALFAMIDRAANTLTIQKMGVRKC